jgi:hypothetical protein
MQEHILKDHINALNNVNFQIAKLLEFKVKLEEEIIKGLKHDHEGSHTYDVGKYKVTVKTDWIYSLDKKKYQLYKNNIPAELNPVKESISYVVDKRIVRQAEIDANADDLLLLGKIISKKPAKPNVKILANI